MTVPAQFWAVDGGERSPNNLAYYISSGVTLAVVTGSITPSIFSAGSPAKCYFGATEIGTYGTVDIAFNPPTAFSSPTCFGGCNGIAGDVSASAIKLINANGNAQVILKLNANGSITVSSGTNVLGTTPINQIFPGAPFHIDFSAFVSATAGEVSIWINGNPAPFTFTGDTEADTTALPITSLLFVITDVPNGFRDIYMHDGTGPAPFNGPLGPGGCVWLPAASTIANSGFVANGLTTLDANAASTPPNPTVDFDSAVAAGNSMTLGVTALPLNVTKVIAVQAVDYAYKSDTGTRALQKSLSFGGTVVEGTENYLATGPVCYLDPWITTDPATSVLFASEGATGIAAVNGVQLTETVAA